MPICAVAKASLPRRVTKLKALLELMGRRDDHVVTMNVTEALVDELKSVETEINDREPNRGVASTPNQSLIDPLDKKETTASAGQAIVQVIMNGSFIGALAVGDFRLGADDIIRCYNGPTNRQAPHQHPAAIIIGMTHPVFDLEICDHSTQMSIQYCVGAIHV
jgi:hypothetical protein